MRTGVTSSLNGPTPTARTSGREESLGTVATEQAGRDISTNRLITKYAKLQAYRKELDSCKAELTAPLFQKIRGILKFINTRSPELLSGLKEPVSVVVSFGRNAARMFFNTAEVGTKDRFNKGRPDLRAALLTIETSLLQVIEERLEAERVTKAHGEIAREVRRKRLDNPREWEQQCQGVGVSALGGALVREIADRLGIPLESVAFSATHPPLEGFARIARGLPSGTAQRLLSPYSSTPQDESTNGEGKSNTEETFSMSEWITSFLDDKPAELSFPKPCQQIVTAILENPGALKRPKDLNPHLTIGGNYRSVLLSQMYDAIGLGSSPDAEKFPTLCTLLLHPECPPVVYFGRSSRELVHYVGEDKDLDFQGSGGPDWLRLVHQPDGTLVTSSELRIFVPLTTSDVNRTPTIERRTRLLKGLGVRVELPLDSLEASSYIGEKLSELFRKGDEKTREVIFLEVYNTTLLLALKMPSCRRLARSDNFNWACAAAVKKALSTFEMTKGSFESYIINQVRYQLLEYIRSTSSLPRAVFEGLRDIEAMQAANPQGWREGLEKFGWDEVGVARLERISAAANPTSLDSLFPEGGDPAETLVENNLPWASDGKRAESIVDEENIHTLRQGMTRLSEESPKLHYVVQARVYEGLTGKQIAAELGVSESRVWQLFNEAVEKLREYFNTETPPTARSSEALATAFPD